MKIGYARVSTLDQDTGNQITRLKSEGCEKVFSEKQSGKSADNRAELRSAIDYVRDGDVLIVTKLDRLARSMGDLWNIIQQLQKKGAEFKVLDQEGIDTTTSHGKLMLNILGSIAEFERDLINARTAEGRKAAMKRGVKFGPPVTITDEIKQAAMADMEAGELSMSEIARKNGVSRASLYRIKGGL